MQKMSWHSLQLNFYNKHTDVNQHHPGKMWQNVVALIAGMTAKQIYI